MAGLVSYPFQLRPGRWVTLLLPSDLTRADVDRIVAILQQLVLPAPTDLAPPATPGDVMRAG